MKGKDKNISTGEIDQCTDIKREREITDDRKQVSAKREDDKLVEPDDLFPLRDRIGIVEAGISDILVNRPNCRRDLRFKGIEQIKTLKY